MLGVLAIVMLYPIAQEKIHADTLISSDDDSLAVSISSDNLSLEADPNVNSGIALGSIIISVQTTNEAGYTMKFNALDSSALSSTDDSNTATIPTLVSDTTLTSFPANHWGYYFGTNTGTINTTYRPVSTTATDIDSTEGANSAPKTHNLTIAARIDKSFPADTYSTQLVVSVVGNISTISQIRYMQDMTSAHCAATSEGKEAQLEDSRDGQLYWVGKMKDGNCWMLQNLALGNTSGATALTSADSNVTSNWNLPASLTSAKNGGTTISVIQSWNFGKWVLATPLLMTNCGSSGSIPSLSSCTKAGFVNVSDTTNFQPTYTATTSKWEGANAADNTLVAVNCNDDAWSGSGTSKVCTAGTYDPHYLVGNYYSWNAATAGTGGSKTSGQAAGSICPKGWKLPRSNSTASGSFAGLLSQYGVSSSLSGTGTDNETYNIAGSPLRFIRSGYVGPGSLLDDAGANGPYWSSTPSSSTSAAYRLNFTTGAVNTANDVSRFRGIPVRCLAE